MLIKWFVNVDCLNVSEPAGLVNSVPHTQQPTKTRFVTGVEIKGSFRIVNVVKTHLNDWSGNKGVKTAPLVWFLTIV